MSAVKKWEYYVAFCSYVETKKAGMFGGAAEGAWMLRLGDTEYPLADGLNRMGSQGYELMGIQLSHLRTGGSSMTYYYTDAHYIFKRPDES